MTDIVKRLRKGDPCGDCKRDRCACVIMEEAADEITRLRAEVEKLRAEVEKLRRSRERYRVAWEKEKRRFTETRAALEEK